MKALIISADNFEDSELLVPYCRLKEAGVEVTVASLSHGATKGKHGYEVAIDKTLGEVIPDDYAILILPGGGGASVGEKRAEGAGDRPELFCSQQTGCRYLPWATDLDQRRSFAGATRHLL